MVDTMKRAVQTHFRSSLFLSLTLLAIGLFPELVFAAGKEQALILPPLDPALRQGAVYEKIRPALLKNGWQPFESTNKFLDGCYVNRSGMAGVHYRSGFKEVELCTEGEVYCAFNYTRGKQCLRVVTKGETRPRVLYWESECWKADPLPTDAYIPEKCDMDED